MTQNKSVRRARVGYEGTRHFSESESPPREDEHAESQATPEVGSGVARVELSEGQNLVN